MNKAEAARFLDWMSKLYPGAEFTIEQEEIDAIKVAIACLREPSGWERTDCMACQDAHMKSYSAELSISSRRGYLDFYKNKDSGPAVQLKFCGVCGQPLPETAGVEGTKTNGGE